MNTDLLIKGRDEEEIFRAIRTLAGSIDDPSLMERLWGVALQMSTPAYRMFAHNELYWNCVGNTPDNDRDAPLTADCAMHLTEAYHTPGFSLDDVDVNDPFDAAWLLVCVRYAFELASGRLPGITPDAGRGIEILRRIASLPPCPARRIACDTLAGCYADGLHVAPDPETALFYRTKATGKAAPGKTK